MNELTLTDAEQDRLRLAVWPVDPPHRDDRFHIFNRIEHAVERIVAARVAEAVDRAQIAAYREGFNESARRVAEAVERERAAWATKIETLAADFDTAIGFRGAATSLRALLAADDTEAQT